MILNADARHIPLPDESVHCVVTSPLDANPVQGLAPEIEDIALGDKLIREALCCDHPNRTVFVRKGSLAGDFSPVLGSGPLERPQAQHSLGAFSFDTQIGKNSPQDRLGRQIGSLEAVKRASFHGVGFLFVVPAPERFRNELDGGFVNHADLDSLVVTRRYTALTAVGFGLLDADVSLPVHKSCDVGQRSVRVF